jgi:hypothetical protein
LTSFTREILPIPQRETAWALRWFRECSHFTVAKFLLIPAWGRAVLLQFNFHTLPEMLPVMLPEMILVMLPEMLPEMIPEYK